MSLCQLSHYPSFVNVFLLSVKQQIRTSTQNFSWRPTYFAAVNVIKGHQFRDLTETRVCGGIDGAVIAEIQADQCSLLLKKIVNITHSFWLHDT
jgi:hypothetical protein